MWPWSWFGQEGIFAFGENTPGRKRIKPGDWIAFYASGVGVVAHARVAGVPEKKFHPAVGNPEKYSWVFPLSDAKLYLDCPVVIDRDLRSRLIKFRNRDPDKAWSWFVQSTTTLEEHDFRLLTQHEG